MKQTAINILALCGLVAIIASYAKTNVDTKIKYDYAVPLSSSVGVKFNVKMVMGIYANRLINGAIEGGCVHE